MYASLTAFQVQSLTLATIILTSAAWVFYFVKSGRRSILDLVWLPLTLWAVFGTLDIVVTAEASHLNPTREANPLARAIFQGLHPLGPPAASILWITLWLTVSYLLDTGIQPLNKGLNAFTQLTLYYSLALGHLYALSGWMGWAGIYYVGFTLNQVTPALNHMVAGVFYLSWVGQAMVLSCLHLWVRKGLQRTAG